MKDSTLRIKAFDLLGKGDKMGLGAVGFSYATWVNLEESASGENGVNEWCQISIAL